MITTYNILANKVNIDQSQFFQKGHHLFTSIGNYLNLRAQ